MNVTPPSLAPWLLLVFSLPSSRASQRVEVWRKLRRYGALALKSSGYVLPNSPANRERLEWLATAIRSYKGQASVAQVQEFDDMPNQSLQKQFIEARSREYEAVLRDLKMIGLPPSKRSRSVIARLHKRFEEITDVDFFGSPLRSRVETLFARLEQPTVSDVPSKKSKAGEYRNRLWITRPRPGIDRVSSAWLITRFIDPEARFTFANDTACEPEAVPFDMFQGGGFGHRGEDCTFETLFKHFSIRDRRVRSIAQIVHDADLHDEKFGRPEGTALDQILNGWAELGIDDHELLERGMSLIEGLFQIVR